MNRIYSLFIVFFIYVSLHSAENNFRIGFFWAWNNPNSQPPELLWKQLDSLRCNYANFGKYENASTLKKILDRAKQHGINAQVEWKPIYSAHYFSTRMVYFAGEWHGRRYFFRQSDPQSKTTGQEISDPEVLKNLSDNIDIQRRNVIHCSPPQHRKGFIAQHLIDDRYPENWIYQVRLDATYYIKARLRISMQNSLAPSTPILRVACVRRSSREIVAEKIITLQDYPELQSGKYEELRLTAFKRPHIYQNNTTGKYVDNPPNPKEYKKVPVTLDFIAYWYGEVETWFDYIKLDSERANDLFDRKLDGELISGMNLFKDHPALEHLLLKDEPEYAYFRSGNYLDKLLSKHSNARGMSVNNKEIFNEDYTLLEDLPEYVVDAYPIRGYIIPVPPHYAEERKGAIDEQMVPRFTTESAYNDSLQKAFNEYFFNEMEPARQASLKYEVPIWYCPQTFSSKIKTENRIKYRCPTPEELEATVYLALLYGAKGLFYFRYTNSSEQTSYIGGVVNDKLQHSENKAKTKWGETFYIGNDLLWETLLRLNPQAEKILKVTQNLTSTAVFDEKNLQPPFRRITNWNRQLSGDIHFGSFKDKTDDMYFMLVNKQCHPNAGQQFTLEIKLLPNHEYIIRDLLHETNFQVMTNSDGTALFNISLGPGKGILCKIVQSD